MPIPCLILPHYVADGPWNMALDEALLDAVAADPTRAYFRTYGWTVPTLSLGYFQSLREAQSDSRWGSVPIVRRPTGGGAIWHHHEVTYALAVPGNHPLARPSRALYRGVHEAIAHILRAQGVDAHRRGEAADARIETVRPFLCFTDHDSEDIVSQGAKLVGSAQRRRAGAILQHGAMLLTRSPLTGELPGAGDFASVSTDPSGWVILLQQEVPRSLGLDVEDHDLPESIRQRATILERTIYRRSAWTARR